MKLYLNAGFGEPLPAADLELIQRLKFDGIRTDVTDWASRGHIEAQAQQFVDTGLRPLFLISKKYDNYTAQIRVLSEVIADMPLTRPAIELIGEPENTARSGVASPEEFATLVSQGHAIIKHFAPGTKVVIGGIQTPERWRLDWLKRAAAAGFPPDTTLGYHTYRTRTDPYDAHDGFQSRAEEFDELRRIADRRPIWNTEVGWHDYPSCVSALSFSCGFFKRKIQFTEPQVADFLLTEAIINESEDAIGMVIYQLNDAAQDPTNESEAHYGIRRTDGTLKPSSRVPELFKDIFEA